LAQKLSDSLKQPFVVENKAGATGTIGAAAVATSQPMSIEQFAQFIRAETESYREIARITGVRMN
jgi:hypothetical protein